MIIVGDCRTELAAHGPFDMLVVDPPYGDTALEWDRHCDGWESAAAMMLKPTGSMWVFGSMRFFLTFGEAIDAAGWRYAQDIVWEKHNGSSFLADRFKRTHEHVVQYYLKSSTWAGVYNDVQKTNDATKRTIRNKRRSTHFGRIGEGHYRSEDGGPRIMRSVVYMRSTHGAAIHPTEKPTGLLDILIKTSCPPGGVVGDLFAGSGAAGESAAFNGRRYIGCEKDAGMAQKATSRLDQLLVARPS